MSEKRFTLIDGIKKGTHSGIWDKQKQNNQRTGDELWIGEVVSMLNEGVMIADENEQLKEDCDNLINDNTELVVELNQDSKKLKEVVEENKELKQKIESLKMEIAELRESEKDNYNITDGLW